MKTIEIEKVYRNNKAIHYILTRETSDEVINDFVENWCENDPCGQIYGYSYSWKVVEDKEIIQSAINKEIEKSNKKIQSLKEWLDEIEIYNLNLKK